MSESWIGIVVGSDFLNMVGLRLDNGSAEVSDDITWSLQQGERHEAYQLIFRRLVNYVQEKHIQFVAIKSSIVSRASTRLCHLEAAELRGVVMAAASQSGARIKMIDFRAVSRNFGQRKADQYIKDNAFWATALNQQIRKDSREAALLILSLQRHSK